MSSSANNWMNKKKLQPNRNQLISFQTCTITMERYEHSQSYCEEGKPSPPLQPKPVPPTSPLVPATCTILKQSTKHIPHHWHHIHPITPSTDAISRICQHQPHHVDFQGSLQPRKSDHHIQDGFLTSQERFWFIPYQPKEQPFGRWQPKERFCYRQV